MVPLRQEDYHEIYRWSTHPSVATTWIYRGATPSFETFMQHLFTSVTAQFVFMRDDRPVGVGAIYDLNSSARHAALRLLIDPVDRHLCTGVDAFILLGKYAFDTFPISRLFLQTNSVSRERFASACQREIFVEEARLANYERFGDQFVDLIYLSFERSQMEALSRQTWRSFPPLGPFGAAR